MKLTLKQKNKIADEWIIKNGAATFNISEKDILLHDGGLFSIENKPVIKDWTKARFEKPKDIVINGKVVDKFSELKFVPRFYKGKVTDKKIVDFIRKKIKKGETFEEEVLHFFNKEKQDNLTACLWFEDLDETIRYLNRMKKMLQGFGYKTDMKW